MQYMLYTESPNKGISRARCGCIRKFYWAYIQ